MLGIVDLFAGCGGLSLGFEMAGFKTLYAVEQDIAASNTYRRNFPNTPVITSDIRYLHPEELIHDNVIGVIGGPPCQGFSYVNVQRSDTDPRNSLFVEFIRFVNYLRPMFFVMENVEGLLTTKTNNGYWVKDIIKHMTNNIGYILHCKTLSADDYSVPQTRKRVIFIAVRKDIEHIRRYIYPCKKTPFNKISTWESISDLPDIDNNKIVYTYTKPSVNFYQKQMRKNCTLIYNHTVFKCTQQIISLFDKIPQGQNRALIDSSYTFDSNYIKPYPNKPCATVVGKSILVHPYKNRSMSFRELARIQSFPDKFIFYSVRGGLRIPRQIGNAVPPLLGYAIAENLKSHLKL